MILHCKNQSYPHSRSLVLPNSCNFILIRNHTSAHEKICASFNLIIFAVEIQFLRFYTILRFRYFAVLGYLSSHFKRFCGLKDYAHFALCAFLTLLNFFTVLVCPYNISHHTPPMLVKLPKLPMLPCFCALYAPTICTPFVLLALSALLALHAALAIFTYTAVQTLVALCQSF